MSRVINTNSPTKVRNQCRRTIAEMLRNLSHKPKIDAEAKDMAAMIVLLLLVVEAAVPAVLVVPNVAGRVRELPKMLGRLLLLPLRDYEGYR